MSSEQSTLHYDDDTTHHPETPSPAQLSGVLDGRLLLMH